MLNHSWLFALPLALLLGCATATKNSPGSDSSIAIERANVELCERYNRGDRAGVAAMYADDAIMIDHKGRRWIGREAIDEYWNPRRPISPDDRWELEVISVEGDPDAPVQRGRSRLHSLRESKPHISDVQFMLFWKMQPDGQFRIVLDAWWPTTLK